MSKLPSKLRVARLAQCSIPDISEIFHPSPVSAVIVSISATVISPVGLLRAFRINASKLASENVTTVAVPPS